MPASPPSPHSRKLSRPITSGWGSEFNSFAGKGVCKTLLTYRVKKSLTDYHQYNIYCKISYAT